MKSKLERVEIPGEHEARERTWSVAATAFSERQPVERDRRMLKPAVAIAFAVAALAAVLSPPGRAVLDEIREVVGVERAQPALFSLPAPGRLLVSSDAGVWVVQQDGSKRLLGDYREASWSPFGRFVVAARENELAALEPDGNVRWTLSRPGVRFPRWTGIGADTRIAYQRQGVPRVVAGDGTDDSPVCAVSARPIAPAWKPGAGFVLALVAPGGTPYIVDLDGSPGALDHCRRRATSTSRVVLATAPACSSSGQARSTSSTAEPAGSSPRRSGATRHGVPELVRSRESSTEEGKAE